MALHSKIRIMTRGDARSVATATTDTYVCVHTRAHTHTLYTHIYIYIKLRIYASHSYITARVETTHPCFDSSMPRQAGSQSTDRRASSQPSSRPGHYDCQTNANGLCIINGPRATTGRGSHDTRPRAVVYIYIRRGPARPFRDMYFHNLPPGVREEHAAHVYINHFTISEHIGQYRSNSTRSRSQFFKISN